MNRNYKYKNKNYKNMNYKSNFNRNERKNRNNDKILYKIIKIRCLLPFIREITKISIKMKK